MNLSREEAEEISFVPSALSVPRGLVFWCDNRCSDKALRFWQFASVVVNNGEEAHTFNLCQQCYNERLTAHGQAPLKSWQWKGSRGKEGASWQIVDKCWEDRTREGNAGRYTVPKATRVSCQ